MSPKMMTVLAWSESTGRQLIGPLTAAYTPPQSLRFGFVQSENNDVSEATLDAPSSYVYENNCPSVRSCLPSIPATVQRDYYSPGLHCPVEWETATELGHGITDSVRVTDILRALSADEMVAFCYPS